jgi:hypothetical protein
MNGLELVGASALYVVGLLVVFGVSVDIGLCLGADKEMDGLKYAIYPPATVLISGATIGLVLLARAMV